MNDEQFISTQRLLPKALRADRQVVRRRLGRLKKQADRMPPEKCAKELDRLSGQLRQSAAVRTARLADIPPLESDPALPITARREEIIRAIRENPVVIISGATGSGKTTQIPKFCVAAGLGTDGRIGCTQPRRIAAMSVARRLAEEIGDTQQKRVGHKIRFSDQTADRTLIKIMTDGILLAEAQRDRYLNEYDAIVVDEAHERSLNIDFILGILKQVLQKRRDLKVIITSATIDTEKFSRAFNQAPIIEVSGRMYPVEVRYRPIEGVGPDKPGVPSNNDGDIGYVEQAVATVDEICARHPAGDILVFMPTAQDIRETCRMLTGRKHKQTLVLPLYAQLPGTQQSKIFTGSKGRKIIVATNIAETSITIPNIRFVVDTGLARISYYSPRSRATSLTVRPISQSSAEQRKGRCGRVAEGVCIRLYAETDFNSRHVFTPPEVLRANLAEVILRMRYLGLGRVADFPFIDPPQPKSITDGHDLLYELGAIVPAQSPKKNADSRGPSASGGYRLTRRGRMMAQIPVDPRLSAILIEAGRTGCITEAAVIVAALSIQDIRQVPPDNIQEAQAAHTTFFDPDSDFLTLLNIWTATRGLATGKLKKFCRDNFISFRRIREWRDVHGQIADIIKEHQLAPGDPRHKPPALDRRNDPEKFYAALHKAILRGFLSNIATKKEGNAYLAAKSKEVMIFPGSTLFNKGRPWIVATEHVETSRLFARNAAVIDRAWLKPLAGDLCRHTWHNPRWKKKQGRVAADCQTTLFGLVIDYETDLPYGPVAPEEATEIFIRGALVECDLERLPSFLEHNQTVINEVAQIEDRLRQRDFLANSEDLFLFYRQRIDVPVFDVKSLKKFIKTQGDQALRLTRDTILRQEPSPDALAQFPEQVRAGEIQLSFDYRFDPADDRDGVTVRVPSGQAPDVPAEQLDWLVPGMLPEKITALIKALPKDLRKRLVPVNATVSTIVREMKPGKRAFLTELSNFIRQRLSVDIPASAWRPDLIPDHLNIRIAVTDDSGDEICASRDRQILRQAFGEAADTPETAQARREWERAGLTADNFPDLPPEISVPIKKFGKTVMLYPALVEAASGADLRLFENRREATAAHGKGVRALLSQRLTKEIKYLKKDVALPRPAAQAAIHFGGNKAVEQNLLDQVIDDFLCRDIRSAGEFNAYARQAAPKMYQHGAKLRDLAARVINQYHDVRQGLSELASAAHSRRDIKKALSIIDRELTELAPDNFMRIYSPDRQTHLLRYMEALLLRAQRLATDFPKDQRKSEQIQWAKDALHRMVSELTPESTDEKRNAVENFFWLVEEYKVSVFAQELKTAVPVSPKRLKKQVEEIDRMV